MITNLSLAREVYNYCSQPKWSMAILLSRNIPWESENNPPDPSPYVKSISQPLAFKPLLRLIPAYSDSEGTLTFGGENFDPLYDFTIDKIEKNEAFYVVAETEIAHEKLDFGSFRELSLVRNLSPNSGIILSPNQIYTPNQILSYSLEMYQTFPPVQVTPPTVQRISMMRPFK